MTKTSAQNLLTAIKNEPAVVERRQLSRRRVKRDRRKGVRRHVGLEISPSGIAVAIFEQSDDQGTRKLIIDRLEFPPGSGPTCGDWGDDTLRDLLSEVAAKYQLAGQAVSVGLGGDPCVTRVVVGDNDEVDSEVAELTERAHRYIGMGRGEKVSCENATRIDAKRKRVWVTVAMRRVVDAIAASIATNGMRLAHLEHTMLVLCQILHAHDKDTSQPVLMIVDERGRMDLGISYHGQLLLDYRPAMPDTTVSEASIVQRHIKCLHRYIGSQLPDMDVDLNDIFVTGTEAELASLYSSIDEQTSLQSHRFPLDELCEGCDVEGLVSEDPSVIAAIGLARHAHQGGVVGKNNDLMSTLKATSVVPWRRLAKAAWPIAASIAVAVGLMIAGERERSITELSERRIESLATVKAETNRVRLSLERHLSRNQQIEAIGRNIQDPQWTVVLWRTGNLLPQGVWLDSIRIDHRGETNIVGASVADEAIYDYIDQLKSAGIYGRVVLESTNVSRVGNGPAYRFEITAQVKQATQTQPTNVARWGIRSTPRG